MSAVQLFYFGKHDHRLFGAFHNPSCSIRSTVVILCYPMGQEYIRSHRAFAQLAKRLCKVGFPVLRFDYFGCGDSAGDSYAGRTTLWLNDIRTAVQTARDLSSQRNVCMVGLRLGATLCALAAERADDIDAAVLWHPVVTGHVYLDELAEAHRRWMKGSFARERAYGANSEKSLRTPAETVIESQGFPIPQLLASDIRAINLSELSHPPASNVLLLTRRAQEAQAGWYQRMMAMGTRASCQVDRGPRVWLKGDDGDANEQSAGLVPSQALATISGWIESTCR